MFVSWKSQAILFPVLIATVVLTVGCGSYSNNAQEEGSSPADAQPVGALEPRHGGRVVELTGRYDAEVVVMDNGMSFVYLYDAEGNPVAQEGKQVRLVVTTPDGKSLDLPLEGMGTGAGAHFMNPIPDEMIAQLKTQGAYTAEVRVMTPEGEQTGQLEIHLGESR